MFLYSHTNLVTLIIPFKSIFEENLFLKTSSVAAHIFNLSTWEVETDWFLSFLLVWV